MDDLKLFGKSKDQIDFLVETVDFFSKDFKMEHGKFRILVLAKGKICQPERAASPDGQTMKEVESDGIVKLDKVKEQKIKRTIYLKVQEET